ncbi:MAG: ribosome biogenesis GTPase Der [Pseudomonadota bacterium]
MSPFTLAIVGRPNVGKSTLFNRLVRQRLALVDDEPGVTRDWREGACEVGEHSFKVLDTAGLEEVFDESLEARMRRQTEAAVEISDLVLFVIDARSGITPVDEHFAQWLRRSGKPVVVLANKAESKASDGGVMEAYALGLGEPIPISAEHGLGLVDLYIEMENHATQAAAERAAVPLSDDSAEDSQGSRIVQLAIVGRPNVGKSTLVNQLLGQDRVLTGPEAGITRDAIALDWSFHGRPVRLVDTAGLRRRAKVSAKVEKLSAADTLRSIRFAQVVILLLDAQLSMDKQDLTIASSVIEEGRALVIGLNKWDSCEDRAACLKNLQDRLTRSLPQTRGIPVVPLSALRGQNTERLMEAVFQIYDVWNTRLPTAQLNRWLEGVTQSHPPPAPGGRRIRLKYVTQAKTRPPTFAIFCSKPDALPGSYLRYLENSLRDDFDLPGTPLRIVMRKGDNPYKGK